MPQPAFTIRDAQMAALAVPRERAFQARLTAQLERRWPPGAAPLDDHSRAAFVARAVERAHATGVSFERDVALFVLLCAGLGEGFENDPRYPWAATIVDDAGASGAQKVALLFEHATAHFRLEGVRREGDA